MHVYGILVLNVFTFEGFSKTSRAKMLKKMKAMYRENKSLKRKLKRAKTSDSDSDGYVRRKSKKKYWRKEPSSSSDESDKYATRRKNKRAYSNCKQSRCKDL